MKIVDEIVLLEYEFVDLESDKEIWLIFIVKKLYIGELFFGIGKFIKYLMWNGLVVGIVCLKYIVRVWSGIL